MAAIADAVRIVFKVGTSTLTHANGNMNIRRVDELVRVLSDMKNAGKEVLLVSSGAIAVGAGYLGLKERPRDTIGKQAAAAVGQSELMYAYDKRFAEFGHRTGQVLLTRDVVENGKSKQNAINTFDRLLEYKVVPIINENDTVSTEEIEFGDNDRLSAMVAALVGADLLVLLTDIDGLYDSDPHVNENAVLIEKVDKIDENVLNLAGGAGSNRGTGGMVTKLQAAEIALNAGIPTVIMNGGDPARIYDLFDGKKVGTIIGERTGK